MPDFFETILESAANKICVIAAPGSGKTSGILIPKLTKILAENNIDPREVLLLTFSRLSAIDLKNKVETMDRKPRASTVHSICLAFLLSENNHDIRKRVESILLDFEKDVLISDLKLVFADIRKTDLRKMLQEFSAGWATQPHDQIFEENERRKAFKMAVVNWLSEHEAAMMEEIVYYAVDLAKKLPNAEFVDKPQYIFVDEYQDLNRLEQEFVELIAAKSKLLLVVGDPDQSIYSFKYAYPAGIREFADRENVEDHSYLITRRCPQRVVGFAAQLLLQAEPTRTQLLTSRDGAEMGEVHFVRKQTQTEEFAYVLKSIAQRIQTGERAQEIIVLVPRKKLGEEFVNYANASKEAAGYPTEVSFVFVLKPDFTEKEKEKILLFGLLVRPESVLRIRSYLGLGDEDYCAGEVSEIRQKYGNLIKGFSTASENDFPTRNIRIRNLCSRIIALRTFLASHSADTITVTAVMKELFPEDEPELLSVRNILEQLREEEDSPKSLFAKLIDYLRTIPYQDNTVRVMTLMASKGLEANHVYIHGCNAGNMPGTRRSSHLTDHEHIEEQRRLLYVGFTRSKKSLSVSWSRLIPFKQSLGHYTKSVGTTRVNGITYSKVGISEFLQNLSAVTWET